MRSAENGPCLGRWIGLRQGCQIGYFMANFEKFDHFLNALGMKKHTWPYCKIWPFLHFAIVKWNLREIFYLFLFYSCHCKCHSNTTGTVLQTCVVLKCGNYLVFAVSWFCTSVSVVPVIWLSVCIQVFLPLCSYDVCMCGLTDGLHHVIMIIQEFRLLFIYVWSTRSKQF